MIVILCNADPVITTIIMPILTISVAKIGHTADAAGGAPGLTDRQRILAALDAGKNTFPLSSNVIRFALTEWTQDRTLAAVRAGYDAMLRWEGRDVAVLPSGLLDALGAHLPDDIYVYPLPRRVASRYTNLL